MRLKIVNNKEGKESKLTLSMMSSNGSMEEINQFQQIQ